MGKKRKSREKIESTGVYLTLGAKGLTLVEEKWMSNHAVLFVHCISQA